MKTIWVVQYNDGTADVFDSEQGAPALPYIDAFEVQNRIGELEEAVNATYSVQTKQAERITELEKALATLMDEYQFHHGFDKHYDAAAVALCF